MPLCRWTDRQLTETEIMEHRASPQSTTWCTNGQLTEIMEHRASPQSTTWNGALCQSTEYQMVDRWTANGKNGGGASPAQSGTRRAELSDADMTMVCV